jgi:hypothetical protein
LFQVKKKHETLSKKKKQKKTKAKKGWVHGSTGGLEFQSQYDQNKTNLKK